MSTDVKIKGELVLMLSTSLLWDDGVRDPFWVEYVDIVSLTDWAERGATTLTLTEEVAREKGLI